MESDRVNRWLMFASNVGVLIGLIFVGVEVRNSGNAVTAQAATAIACYVPPYFHHSIPAYLR